VQILFSYQTVFTWLNSERITIQEIACHRLKLRTKVSRYLRPVSCYESMLPSR
jgi:hypothetical protein